MYIQEGDVLELRMPLTESKHKNFDLKLEVLYEDAHLALIHKPAGVLTSGNSFMTIANALTQNLTTSTETDAIAPQPAHRLDFATTGILAVGKTRSTLQYLNQIFEQQKVKKVYYAIAIGNMRDYGEIDLPIDEKEAKTYYKVIDQVASPRFGQLQLVQLMPITGRRHQLRKHLFALGCPILGDPTYYNERHRLKGKGLYLHAYSLSFVHPISKKSIQYSDVLPNRFRKIFNIELPSDFLLR